MTTAQGSVAVMATRLPITDRRALSQAWYSALHVPQVQPAAAAAKPVGPASGPVAVSRAAHVRTLGASVSDGKPVAARSGAGPGAVTAGFAERRSASTDVARRIERAIVRHVAAPSARPATIAVNAGDGRIALLVRHDGATTRIVALCAPHLRERVDRALAQARFALAAAGTPIEAA